MQSAAEIYNYLLFLKQQRKAAKEKIKEISKKNKHNKNEIRKKNSQVLNSRS